MCTYFINWDGGGESQAFEGGFLVIDFAEFFVDQVVRENAQVDDLWSNRDFFDEFPEDFCR